MNNNKGQSAVEYIMLLAVISVITFSILKSHAFKNLVGGDAEVFVKAKGYLSYSYRHGLAGYGQDSSGYGNGSIHESYYKDGDTRFFLVGRKK